MSLALAPPLAHGQSPAVAGGDVFDVHLIGDQNAVVNDGGCATCSCCDTGCAALGMPTPYDPADPTMPAPQPAPAESDLSFLSASSQGALGAQGRVAMIGDFFGPVVPTTVVAGSDGVGDGLVTTINTGGIPGVQSGRQKIVENTSPIPLDRVYFNYSYFDNVPLLQDGLPVNRFTPGFEKTFCCGQLSFETRFPFASTLASDTLVASDPSGRFPTTVFGPETNQIEFGNITMYLKGLLLASETHALAAGVGMTLPTANDQRLLDIGFGGDRSLEVQNEAVHLLPFIGGVYTPDDRFFAQAFLQVDVDLNGNPVRVGGGDTDYRFGINELPPVQVGTVNDPTFLYFDIGAGYWVYRNDCCDACISGIAPRAELHYNLTVSDPDVVSFARENPDGSLTGLGFEGSVASGLDDDFEVLNAVLGLTVELHHESTMTIAYVTPIGGDDQVFDGELRVLLNYFYGPTGAGRRSVFAR